MKIYRSLSLFTFSLGLALAAAQDQPAEPPKMSITASNQTAAEVLLTLTPRPDFRQPLSSPPVRMTNQVRSFTRQVVPPSQSASFDLAPGRYLINAILHQPTSQRPRPLNGIITVTNSETWLFSLKEQTPTSPVHAQQLILEIPSRPGFRLTGLAERSLPQRPQNTNFPSIGTNAIHLPPSHELKLPPTNQ